MEAPRPATEVPGVVVMTMIAVEVAGVHLDTGIRASAMSHFLPDRRRGHPRRSRIISKKPSGPALPIELELYF